MMALELKLPKLPVGSTSLKSAIMIHYLVKYQYIRLGRNLTVWKERKSNAYSNVDFQYAAKKTL